MLLIKTAKETQLRVAASLEEAQRQRPRTTELQALSAASGAYPTTPVDSWLAPVLHTF